jgi:uncharacterized LabA/DUF88 family protein
MKAGIFLDIDNLTRNGGLKIRFDAIKQLVQSQGADVLRANAYMAVDKDMETRDPEVHLKWQEFRDSLRRAEFHLVLKPLRRFINGDGQVVASANCILELAIDAVLQSAPLDYVLIGSGDGDVIRLIRALQERGKRVDVLTFGNASSQLQRAADNAFSGFLVPGLLPAEEGAPSAGRRLRGQVIEVDEEAGVGKLAVRTGMGPADFRRDVEIRLANFSRAGSPVSKEQFTELRERGTVIEFDMAEVGDGRVKAINAREYRREDKPIFLPPIEDET